MRETESLRSESSNNICWPPMRKIPIFVIESALMVKSVRHFMPNYNSQVGKVEIHRIVVVIHRIAKDPQRDYCNMHQKLYAFGALLDFLFVRSPISFAVGL